MNINRKFPNTRLRRLRLNSSIRNLVSEFELSTNDMIQTFFVKEGLSGNGSLESIR